MLVHITKQLQSTFSSFQIKFTQMITPGLQLMYFHHYRLQFIWDKTLLQCTWWMPVLQHFFSPQSHSHLSTLFLSVDRKWAPHLGDVLQFYAWYTLPCWKQQIHLSLITSLTGLFWYKDKTSGVQDQKIVWSYCITLASLLVAMYMKVIHNIQFSPTQGGFTTHYYPGLDGNAEYSGQYWW